ncbi:YggS family pyridoxal phosphate-dependent enzyme [Mycoplasmatota bacterium]|nr:YggS family pyridoxal phosphate-dependent enzyme [Mycoplasmatota bacterium]
MNIKENVKMVKEEIATIKNKYLLSYDVKICAATKYVGVDEIDSLLEEGVSDFGENRVNAFLEKEQLLHNKSIIWHFIGSLQTNKVKKVINKIDYLHSLDRESLAKEINKYRDDVLNCFIEVNCSEEDSKHGLNVNEVKSFVQLIEKYDKIRVIGLMTMAENTQDETIIRETFKKLKTLQSEIQDLNLIYAPCNQLSMGMSNDFHIAIEEGATFVRIGSRLFK